MGNNLLFIFLSDVRDARNIFDLKSLPSLFIILYIIENKKLVITIISYCLKQECHWIILWSVMRLWFTIFVVKNVFLFFFSYCAEHLLCSFYLELICIKTNLVLLERQFIAKHHTKSPPISILGTLFIRIFSGGRFLAKFSDFKNNVFQDLSKIWLIHVKIL